MSTLKKISEVLLIAFVPFAILKSYGDWSIGIVGITILILYVISHISRKKHK